MTRSSADAAVTEALRRLVWQFDLTELQLVTGETEGVHNHRTVVRRLRSVVSVFGEIYDPDDAENLKSQLREWGSTLGAVRDHEVAAAQLEDLLAEEVDDESFEAVHRRLVAAERKEGTSARRRLIDDTDSDRHRTLRRDLHRFVVEPPLTHDVTGKPTKRLRRRILREGRRVLRKAENIDSSPEAQHEVRKAARRLRYAAEALTSEPVALFGKRIRRVGRRAHKIQSILGDRLDALHAAELAARASVAAASAGEDTAVYVALEQSSMRHADERAAAYDPAIGKLETAIEQARH